MEAEAEMMVAERIRRRDEGRIFIVLKISFANELFIGGKPYRRGLFCGCVMLYAGPDQEVGRLQIHTRTY